MKSGGEVGSGWRSRVFSDGVLGRDVEDGGEVFEEEGGSRGERREWGINGVTIFILR